MSDNESSTLTGQPTQPVQAGAIVRLRGQLEASSPPDEPDEYYRITWHIVGPFSDDEEFVEGTSRFDLNTAGRRPAPTPSRVRTPRAESRVADAGADAGGGAEPATRAVGGMPVAVRSGTARFDQLTGGRRPSAHRLDPTSPGR